MKIRQINKRRRRHGKHILTTCLATLSTNLIDTIRTLVLCMCGCVICHKQKLETQSRISEYSKRIKQEESKKKNNYFDVVISAISAQETKTNRNGE